MSEYEPETTISEPETAATEAASSEKSSKLWLVIVLGVLIIGLLVTGIVFLSRAGTDVTGKVRDIFIILMALESIVIGAALIILWCNWHL
jgi:NADH:ubiquinone oxidoreductase subunit K